MNPDVRIKEFYRAHHIVGLSLRRMVVLPSRPIAPWAVERRWLLTELARADSYRDWWRPTPHLVTRLMCRVQHLRESNPNAESHVVRSRVRRDAARGEGS